MRAFRIEKGLEDFKMHARQAIALRLDPSQVRFEVPEAGDLFSMVSDAAAAAEREDSAGKTVTVPPAFAKLAVDLAHHAAPQKWALLYRLLWRLKFENPRLLEIATDNDVHAARIMQKAIHREVHKIHAFVRFQEVDGHFVAWMRTDHPCLPLAAGLFVRRFGDRPWSILTPLSSAHWDGEKLTHSEGVDQPPEREEQLDTLWKSYYKSIFNPARVKTKAMRAEMPTRYWGAMPEASLIPEMLREVPERLKAMAAKQNEQAVIPETKDWHELEKAARNCRACPLGASATHTVFGEGPRDARFMIVGEQPGDQEDQVGRAFIGPAGEVLNAAMRMTGVSRPEIYITNAVKHFKWKPGPPGKPRLHQKPSGAEMHACKPWLEREIDIVKPKVILCLGQTAGTALLGRMVKITEEIGKVHRGTPWADYVLVSYHPSAILRAMDEREAARMKAELTRALAFANDLAHNLPPEHHDSEPTESKGNFDPEK